MFRYEIFIFTLLIASVSFGKGLVEPTEMFTCNTKSKVDVFKDHDAALKAEKIDCRDITGLHWTAGPDSSSSTASPYLLVWERVKNKDGEWLKIKIKAKYFWIRMSSTVGSLKSIEKHFQQSGVVFALFNSWNGKLYTEIDGEKTIDTHIKLRNVYGSDVTVAIKSIRYFHNKLWFKIQLYDDDLCDPPKPPSETYSGWVHLLNDADEPIIGDSFCG